MQGFIQDFVLGKVRGKCVGGRHRRAVVMVDCDTFIVTNRRIRLHHVHIINVFRHIRL